MDILQYAPSLRFENGMYVSGSTPDISYPDHGNEEFNLIEEFSFWFGHRNAVLSEAVAKYAPGTTLFDVGGGNGFVSKSLQEAGINTVLVEPGRTGCMNARASGLKNIICSTLQCAGFADNSLPAVGLFDVLEHIEDDAQFLKDVFRLLKPGGYFFITVPAYNALWSPEDDHAGHFRRYSLRDLDSKLTKTGFRTHYKSYLFSILPLPIWLFRSLPSKVGIGKGGGEFARHKKHHGVDNRLYAKLSNFLLKPELRRIKNGKKVHFGSSCFIVAQKL